MIASFITYILEIIDKDFIFAKSVLQYLWRKETRLKGIHAYNKLEFIPWKMLHYTEFAIDITNYL